MVFEEHEVNEDIRPMTAFESEKEIGKGLPLIEIHWVCVVCFDICLKKNCFMTMLYDIVIV